jgi:putative membrane protein
LIILKRIGLALLIILIFSAMVVFTAGNPDDVPLKLLAWKISPPVSLAFTAAFAIGWLFGIICMGMYAFKVASERRMLRRFLRMSEDEVSSLRSLPLSDAD